MTSGRGALHAVPSCCRVQMKAPPGGPRKLPPGLGPSQPQEGCLFSSSPSGDPWGAWVTSSLHPQTLIPHPSPPNPHPPNWFALRPFNLGTPTCTPCIVITGKSPVALWNDWVRFSDQGHSQIQLILALTSFPSVRDQEFGPIHIIKLSYALTTFNPMTPSFGAPPGTL